MAPPTVTRPPQTVAEPVDRQADRYEAVQQYSLSKILGVWAAAAVPMGVLAWIVAHWLRDQIGGRDPFVEDLRQRLRRRSIQLLLQCAAER